MRPIRTLIDTKYLTKARFIDSATASIRSRISSDMRANCWVADITGNCLIIVTDRAEHATLLRYQQHELVKQINEEFTSSLITPVKRLKVKVDYRLANLTEQRPAENKTGLRKNNNGRKHCANLLDLLKN